MKKADGKAIGERIKRRRIELGYTQEKLAELCSVSTSYLGHIERGSRLMSVNMLLILSDTLKMSTDEILFDSFSKTDDMVHIQTIINNSSPETRKKFLNIAEILAENIEKL